MAKPSTLTIEILNWDRFNPRKDVKNSSWFRLEHSLFDDPDFYDLTHAELAFWIYLLCHASKKNSPKFVLSFAHAERVGRFKQSEIKSALEKLEAIQCVLVGVTDTLRPRNEGVTETCTTNETGRDERDDTERDGTNAQTSERVNVLFELWNQERGSLPECCEISEERRKKARAQLKKYPDLEHWRNVIHKFLASEFCVNEWKPGIDDLLSESKRLRALEGKYDKRNRGRSPPVTREQQVIDHNRSQYERILKGEL